MNNDKNSNGKKENEEQLKLLGLGGDSSDDIEKV